MMKFYENIDAERLRIERAIQKYGYAPEHNFKCYQYSTERGDKNIFVEFKDGALLTAKDEEKSEYWVFSSPLALPLRRASILIEYVGHIFTTTDARKIWFEMDSSLRREFIRALPDSFRAMPINYTLTAPVMDMEKFDPELPGGHYKSMRKEKHRFYRNHLVEVQDAKTYKDREALLGIVATWRQKRNPRDRVWSGFYENAILDNFEGMTEARIFVVDGKPVGINAGWMIPNSDSFYGAIGIHDYSIDDLGTMLYLEDLIWLKLRGYHEVDMGGNEKWGLVFKNKFCPTSYYKTFIFSVVKRSFSTESIDRKNKS